MIKKILSLIFLVTIFINCGQKPESKEVLFVCTHGAARSPIAAAYFNKITKEENLNYHAVFRGTEPDEFLTPGTTIGLTKDDFIVSSWKPEKVSAQDMERAYKVVTFDCLLPENNAASLIEEKWDGTPPISKDYDKARDVIKGKVEQLIKSLDKN